MIKPRKAIALVIAIFIFTLTACTNSSNNLSDNTATPTISTPPQSDNIPSNPAFNENSNEGNATPQDTSTDILILVNNDNKLPENYEPDLTTDGAPMAKVTFDSFREMRLAAREDKIFLMVASAYRTAEEQERLFNELGSSIAARPGYSEHQTGLAIDFSYGGLTQEETNRMWNWLAKNANKYGFILRYPEGRENITGFAYEPWHYRYVGKEHAKAIYEQGLVLEEYLSISP